MARKYDSTKTRVEPILNAIAGQIFTPAGLSGLLGLPVRGSGMIPADQKGMAIQSLRYGDDEAALAPPVSLLAWLIRHAAEPTRGIPGKAPMTLEKRKALVAGDPATVGEALCALRTGRVNEVWYILEGPTYPDVFIETEGALVVIEGKRTERGPTTKTTWMKNRHQMLRHIDCAFEIRGRRSVYGFLLVEGNHESRGEIPEHWLAAADDTLSTEAVNGSLPHRSREEQKQISDCFLGVTTWQIVCDHFGVGWADVVGMATNGDAENA